MAADSPNRYNLLRALVLAAVRTAPTLPQVNGANQTPTQVLEGILLGKFNAEITDGKILIHSAEAGGATQFALLPDMSPAEIVDLLMETITWIQTQPDPANPCVYPPRRIKRLRASFAKATI
jgi:hypothetical protein